MGSYYQSIVYCDWCGEEEASEPAYDPGDLPDDSDMAYNFGWFQGEINNDWVTLCEDCSQDTVYCESCDNHYETDQIGLVCDDGEPRCPPCVDHYHDALQDDILYNDDKRTQYVCDVHEIENSIFIDTPQVQWKL